jgi:hypothetical protein
MAMPPLGWDVARIFTEKGTSLLVSPAEKE